MITGLKLIPNKNNNYHNNNMLYAIAIANNISVTSVYVNVHHPLFLPLSISK